MTRPALACVTLVLAILLNGCGQSEGVATMQKFIDEMKALNAILDGVHTAQDAEAAAPKLEALAKRLNELAPKVKKHAKDKAAKSTVDRMTKTGEVEFKRFESNMSRIEPIAGDSPAFQQAIQNVGVAILAVGMAAQG
jgi:hypothetical protein